MIRWSMRQFYAEKSNKIVTIKILLIKYDLVDSKNRVVFLSK